MSTRLLDAAKNGNVELTKRCLADGDNVNHTSDYDGTTALYWAVCAGHFMICSLLVEKDADVNAVCSQWGSRPLLAAADRGHLDCARLLIQRGADINQSHRHSNLDTPLHRAAYRGNLEMCRLLLDNGARTDVINREKRTAQQQAQHARNYTVYNYMEERERKCRKYGIDQTRKPSTDVLVRPTQTKPQSPVAHHTAPYYTWNDCSLDGHVGQKMQKPQGNIATNSHHTPPSVGCIENDDNQPLTTCSSIFYPPPDQVDAYDEPSFTPNREVSRIQNGGKHSDLDVHSNNIKCSNTSDDSMRSVLGQAANGHGEDSNKKLEVVVNKLKRLEKYSDRLQITLTNYKDELCIVKKENADLTCMVETISDIEDHLRDTKREVANQFQRAEEHKTEVVQLRKNIDLIVAGYGQLKLVYFSVCQKLHATSENSAEYDDLNGATTNTETGEYDGDLDTMCSERYHCHTPPYGQQTRVAEWNHSSSEDDQGMQQDAQYTGRGLTDQEQCKQSTETTAREFSSGSSKNKIYDTLGPALLAADEATLNDTSRSLISQVREILIKDDTTSCVADDDSTSTAPICPTCGPSPTKLVDFVEVHCRKRSSPLPETYFLHHVYTFLCIVSHLNSVGSSNVLLYQDMKLNCDLVPVLCLNPACILASLAHTPRQSGHERLDNIVNNLHEIAAIILHMICLSWNLSFDMNMIFSGCSYEFDWSLLRGKISPGFQHVLRDLLQSTPENKLDVEMTQIRIGMLLYGPGVNRVTSQKECHVWQITRLTMILTLHLQSKCPLNKSVEDECTRTLDSSIEFLQSLHEAEFFSSVTHDRLWQVLDTMTYTKTVH